MAGSFGDEKEYYGLSMKIGELILFSTVRKTDHKDCIAVPRTRCHQQIKDGMGRTSILCDGRKFISNTGRNIIL